MHVLLLCTLEEECIFSVITFQGHWESSYILPQLSSSTWYKAASFASSHVSFFPHNLVRNWRTNSCFKCLHHLFQNMTALFNRKKQYFYICLYPNDTWNGHIELLKKLAAYAQHNNIEWLWLVLNELTNWTSCCWCLTVSIIWPIPLKATSENFILWWNLQYSCS